MPLVLLLLGGIAMFVLASGRGGSLPALPVPPPPDAPPPPSPPLITAGDVKYTTWYNWATGQADPDAPGFLTWGPGQDAPAPVVITEILSARAPALPKAGEKWQFTFDLNRPLSFFEMSAAKSAFSEQIPDQHLDSAMQNGDSTPPTVTISTTYTKDATSKSFPLGYTISKSGITATVSNARRVG